MHDPARCWHPAVVALLAAVVSTSACGGAVPTPSPTEAATPTSSAAPTVPTPTAPALPTVTPTPARMLPAEPPATVGPTDAPVTEAAATSARCPYWSEETPRPVVLDDGTTFDLVAESDGDGGAACWLVASTVHGESGVGWQVRLDSMLDRVVGVSIVRGGPDTLFFLLGLLWCTDYCENPDRLLVVGSEGVRAYVPIAWRLQAAPSGTLYLRSQRSGTEPEVADSLAALGPNGLPAPGWPYTVSGSLGWPVFASDGTAYLTQTTSAGDALVALAPDGTVLRGWPYSIPGNVFWTWYGQRAPGIVPDGSLYDAFENGIYWVGPDGRSRPGWPYLLPEGTRVAWQEHFGPDAPAFSPIPTAAGGFYLPVTRQATPVTHNEVLCLDAWATPCPGWPVRLPDGWVTSEFFLDEAGEVQLTLGRYTPGREWWRNVTIRPDGTQLAQILLGDTISGLADAYGISQGALLRANPQVTDPALIHPGDMLVIPGQTTQ